LRGNEAGQAAPQRYAHDAHDDHGRSKLGNERCPDRRHAADAGGSTNDPKPGKNGNSGRPLFPKSHLPVFSLLLLLEKLF
jgi:hypothetical protein